MFFNSKIDKTNLPLALISHTVPVIVIVSLVQPKKRFLLL